MLLRQICGLTRFQSGDLMHLCCYDTSKEHWSPSRSLWTVVYNTVSFSYDSTPIYPSLVGFEHTSAAVFLRMASCWREGGGRERGARGEEGKGAPFSAFPHPLTAPWYAWYSGFGYGYITRFESGSMDSKHTQTKIKQLDFNCRYFTKVPHFPGSKENHDLANYIKKKWTEYGFSSATLKKYLIMLSRPTKPGIVALYDDVSGKELSRSAPQEAFLVPSENNSNVVTPFNAYSPSGSVKVSDYCCYPTLLVIVQKTHETSTNIPQY